MFFAFCFDIEFIECRSFNIFRVAILLKVLYMCKSRSLKNFTNCKLIVETTTICMFVNINFNAINATMNMIIYKVRENLLIEIREFFRIARMRNSFKIYSRYDLNKVSFIINITINKWNLSLRTSIDNRRKQCASNNSNRKHVVFVWKNCCCCVNLDIVYLISIAFRQKQRKTLAIFICARTFQTTLFCIL